MNNKYQYDKIGNEYISGQESFFRKKEDWSRIAVSKHLGDIENKKILDIGCGGGIDFRIFETKRAEVYGIDPSETMVEAAKKRVKNPKNIQIGEYENIPFSDNSFDIVFGRFSLHYLKNFDKAYKEINRVLVPKGKLLLVVSHPTFDLSYLLEKGHENSNMISVHLYDNKVKVTFPFHILRDYFSPVFFELFDLIGLDEYSEKELKERKPTISGALIYYAKKRK